jgi:hypothetical protein
MRSIDLRRIAARTSRDRLYAFALAIPENSHRVDRERLPSAVVLQLLADLAEIAGQPLCGGTVNQVAHEARRSRPITRGN